MDKMIALKKIHSLICGTVSSEQVMKKNPIVNVIYPLICLQLFQRVQIDQCHFHVHYCINIFMNMTSEVTQEFFGYEVIMVEIEHTLIFHIGS